MSTPIILAGMPGAGKTAIGRILAARLSRAFIDLDEVIESSHGRTVVAIINAEGEAAFRAIEQDTVRRLAALASRPDDVSSRVAGQAREEEGHAAPLRTRQGIPLLPADCESAIVATGGWTIGHQASRRLLKALGPLVLLDAAPGTLATRISASGDEQGRPLLTTEDDYRAEPLEARLGRLLAQRWPVYGSLPLQVNTDQRSESQAADAVVALLEAVGVLPPRHFPDDASAAQEPSVERRSSSSSEAAPWRSWRAVPLWSDGHRSSLLVGEAVLQHFGALVAARDRRGRLAMVTDANVGPLYGTLVTESIKSGGAELLRPTPGKAVGQSRESVADQRVAPVVDGADWWTIGVGEAAKGPETIAALWRSFIEAGIDRRDGVLALGGGVVTDTAGFAAATMLRGVEWLAVPTTLLAMVDAAIGGKTGINLRAGKNLVGAFWPPALVVADPLVLATLEGPVLRAGLSEVVKAGLIGDPELLTELESHGAPGRLGWTALIARAAAVKASIVTSDARETEGGRRVLLNLGHTFAHGIESATAYRTSHGDAVAIGLVAATHLAARIGLAQPALVRRVTELIDKLGLPTVCAADPGAVLAAMATDKKRFGGGLRFVLPAAPGDVRLVSDISLADVSAVVTTVSRAGL